MFPGKSNTTASIDSGIDISKVKLFTEKRTSEKGPCYEISCDTEKQATFIESQLVNSNIAVHNVLRDKKFWRVKFDKSPQAEQAALFIIGQKALDKSGPVKVLPKDNNRTAQLKFVDYFIRNRTNKKHQQDYADRVQMISKLSSEQRVYFRLDFLPAYRAQHHKDHLKLGYKPLTDVVYDPKQIDLAPDKADAHYRSYTKYRIVYGPLPYYLNGFDNKPVIIDTISACAVNLMGSSLSDENKFMSKGRLNEEEYRKECTATADFLLNTAGSRGADKFIMPAFGVGVYIKKLNQDDKIKAKEIMNKAFAEMAKKHKITVDWVVYMHAKGAAAEKDTLDGHTQGNTFMNHVIADLMEYAQQQKGLCYNCVMLNPGSDRTIGGAYATENPETLEEKMAQISDLMFLHSAYNDQMMSHFETDLKEALENSKKPTSVKTEAHKEINQQDEQGPTEQLINVLKEYKLKRENFKGPNPEYKTTFFGIGLGFSKTQKLKAVEALKEALRGQKVDLHPHLATLNNGELGKSIRKFLYNTDLFNGEKIKTCSDLVEYLSGQVNDKPVLNP